MLGRSTSAIRPFQRETTAEQINHMAETHIVLSAVRAFFRASIESNFSERLPSRAQSRAYQRLPVLVGKALAANSPREMESVAARAIRLFSADYDRLIASIVAPRVDFDIHARSRRERRRRCPFYARVKRDRRACMYICERTVRNRPFDR